MIDVFRKAGQFILAAGVGAAIPLTAMYLHTEAQREAQERSTTPLSKSIDVRNYKFRSTNGYSILYSKTGEHTLSLNVEHLQTNGTCSSFTLTSYDIVEGQPSIVSITRSLTTYPNGTKEIQRPSQETRDMNEQDRCDVQRYMRELRHSLGDSIEYNNQ